MRDLVDDSGTSIERLEQGGMITLRADLSDAATSHALEMCGLTVPAQRQILPAPAGGVGWMSPDELLILCAAEQAGGLAVRAQPRLRHGVHLG